MLGEHEQEFAVSFLNLKNIRGIQERIGGLVALPSPRVCFADPSHFAVLEFNSLFRNWNGRHWIGKSISDEYGKFHQSRHGRIQKQSISLYFFLSRKAGSYGHSGRLLE